MRFKIREQTVKVAPNAISLDSSEEVNVKDLVTVVLPTLNEAEAIGRVIDEIKECGYKNILVVDGYSTDDTVRIAKEKGANVVFQQGKGKAGAIRTAIDIINTSYMVVMNAQLYSKI